MSAQDLVKTGFDGAQPLLSYSGHPPSAIQTTDRAHLRIAGGAPAIQQIDPCIEAYVPGLDPEEFQN